MQTHIAWSILSHWHHLFLRSMETWGRYKPTKYKRHQPNTNRWPKYIVWPIISNMSFYSSTYLDHQFVLSRCLMYLVACIFPCFHRSQIMLVSMRKNWPGGKGLIIISAIWYYQFMMDKLHILKQIWLCYRYWADVKHYIIKLHGPPIINTRNRSIMIV